MRKPVRIALIAAAAILVIVLGLVTYAVVNLNSLIRDNRDRVLARLSDSIGRPVQVSDVRAGFRVYGVVLDITGLRIGDDPALSQLPLIQADEVIGQANFLPLLFGRLHLSRAVVRAPEVRLIRDDRGALNLATLGKKPKRNREAPRSGHREQSSSESLAETAEPAERSSSKPREGVSPLLTMISVGTFNVENGAVSYRDLSRGGATVECRDIDLEVRHFSVLRPFTVALKLAALEKEQNIKVSATVGPLVSEGALNPNAIPFDATLRLGPLSLDQLREIAEIGSRIPEKLALSGPVVAEIAANGKLESFAAKLTSDLTANRVAYAGVLDKPAGVALTLAGAAKRSGSDFSIDSADVVLAGLKLKAGDISFEHGVVQAQIDTNHFDISGPAKVIAPVARLGPTGQAEMHVHLRMANKRPEAQGVIVLSRAAVSPPGGKIPAISDLTGTIRLTGNGGAIEPTTFNVGSSHARLEARADSLDPLRASFSLSADTLNLAELVPSRKTETPEQINALAIRANAFGTLSMPQISADITSSSGTVSNVAYRNLSASLERAGERIDARSLSLDAFGGSISASGRAMLAAVPSFDVRAKLDNVDVEQALASQRAKAAGIARGKLSGDAEVAGRGSNFDQIKPTLTGSGRAALRDGKLVGVNVASQALKKANGIPAIGDLVPPDVVARHPELFASPDTDIRAASLTFALQGPRIVSHDIDIRSSDYRLTGDGWFDMDKNIDLSARILLTKQLSDEIETRKHNVGYLANADGEVQIPLRVTGALPKPLVVPDIGAMADTAAKHAVQGKAEKFLGGLLGGKKHGGSTPSSPSNPFAPLKQLFR